MINASGTPGKETDPNQDRASTQLPPGINEYVLIARTLAAYGRHLAGLLKNHTIWRGFVTVARFFGTVDLVEILPRIQRGLMRATALEAMLLQQAQLGRDVVFKEPPAAKAPRATPPAPASYRPIPRKAAQSPLTSAIMFSMEEIEEQVRRSPVGRTVAAICLDLAVSPSLCTGPFWNRLFEAMTFFKGNLIAVVSEFAQRQERFEAEARKRPYLPRPEQTREGIRQALGFFIGEDLPDAFQPAPAALAGPS